MNKKKSIFHRTAEDHTIFTVFSQVKFKKPVWSLVKTLIEKNANDGMDNYYADLSKHLQMEFCAAPTTKAKRHRRGKLQIFLKVLIKHNYFIFYF